MIPYYEKYVKLIRHPIKKALKRGFKKEDIESKLHGKHWPDDVINEAFKEVIESLTKKKKKLALNILYWLGLIIAVSSFLVQDYFIYLIAIGILLMLLSVPMKISERREQKAIEQAKPVPLRQVIPPPYVKGQVESHPSFFARLFSRKPKEKRPEKPIEEKKEEKKKESRKPEEKRLIVKKIQPKNPALALFLSLIIPGLGQFYNGQAKKGIIILLTFWLVIPWLYGIIDAYKTAREINSHIKPPELKPGDLKKEEKKQKRRGIGIRIVLVIFILLLVAINYIGFTGLYGFSTRNSITYSVIILIVMFILLSLSKRKGKDKKKVEDEEEKEKKVELDVLKKEVTRKQESNETDFDRLHRMVEKYGRIKLSDIAETFNISKKEAEEWAAILEHHNLASIYYPAVGGPEIVRARKKKKTEEEEEEENA